jgi:Glycosyltransferase like family
LILFASAMTDPEAYRRYARPGIRMAAEPGSVIHAFAAVGSVCRSYNMLLDRAALESDLEALVLVQQDVEILDPAFCDKVRRALEDPDVAVVGAVGATGVSTIAWWEGEISAAPVVQRYQAFGGGELPAFGWKERAPAPAEVEVVDGRLMVLSRWALDTLRFDESLQLGYGYELDLCLKARAAGRKVTAADLRVAYHTRTLRLLSDYDLWIEGHIQAAERLAGRLPEPPLPPGGWTERARRAEAEREAARTLAYSNEHQVDAELAPLRRALAELTGSTSWRVTEPLRRLNQWRRRA